MLFLWLLNFLFLLYHRQDRIDHGELIRWTKGFGAPNTEGRDVAEMFITSLKTHVCVAFALFPAAILNVLLFCVTLTMC